ncbi:hypothetical protein HYPSUDRAFT_149630, partial [Hypholoma sublateritium FD-334 SS-4]
MPPLSESGNFQATSNDAKLSTEANLHPPSKEGRFLDRLKEVKKHAIERLRRWTVEERRDEVTATLLQSLLTASHDQAVHTLRDLKHPRHIIKRLGNRLSLRLDITFQTTDTNSVFDNDGLLDCGATGLYVSPEFVRTHDLNVEKLAHPIPVYNADKSPNKLGPIREVVTLRIKIHDHVETTTFAITDTGN